MQSCEFPPSTNLRVLSTLFAIIFITYPFLKILKKNIFEIIKLVFVNLIVYSTIHCCLGFTKKGWKQGRQIDRQYCQDTSLKKRQV